MGEQTQEQTPKPTASDTMPRTIVDGSATTSNGMPKLQLADSHIDGKTTVLYSTYNILHLSEVETLRLVGALLSSMGRHRERRGLVS